jgi:HEAT repeat protein
MGDNKKGTLIAVMFLTVAASGSLLRAGEAADLINELSGAIKDGNRAAIEKVSQKLIEMGDAAIPLLNKGFDSGDKPLRSQFLQILRQMNTAASTKMLLKVVGIEKDKHIMLDAMQVLQYRAIDMPVEQPPLNLMLQKVQEGELPFAPIAARILGKMKRVDPKIRTETLVAALQKETSQQPGTEELLLPGAYVTASQYKIRQFIFALEDIGTAAVPYISRVLDTTSDRTNKEYLTICLCLTGGKKTPSPEVKSEIVRIARSSSNGYIRALGIRLLCEWEEKTLIPQLKDALDDNFKVAVKTDLVTPDMHKGADGCYYFDYYPVRSEAFSALLKLGVKVESKGKGIYKIVE